MASYNFSIAGLKNAADELRAQVYPKNETERKVRDIVYVQVLRVK